MKSILLIGLIFLLSCSHTQNEQESNRENDQTRLKSPYILLISIDGYRHDYTDMYDAENLKKFLIGAAKAKSLKPSFPSKTFPNHYSIVTGLVPDNHGIVANHFYEPEMKMEYKLSNREMVKNPKFYGGTPFWNLTQQNGMNSASFFWPGSEAKINDMYPTFWKTFSMETTHTEKIEGIINWLKLPENKRPHFLTLYFHDVDSAGHKYGPVSPETRQAVQKVDNSLGKLFTELEKMDLPLNIIIVSDHGMTAVDKHSPYYLEDIYAEDYPELKENFTFIGMGPIIHSYFKGDEKNKKKLISKLVHILNSKRIKARAFSREDIPSQFKLNKNPRIGDVLIMTELGKFIGQKSNSISEGNHGYDNNKKDMHGIFYAKGPNIVPKTLPTIDNTSIYNFMAQILDIEVKEQNDGTIRHLLPIVKK
ncbi:type I phosphodiesterase/nucleotide pyrophosphatase [Bacteriovorax sp. BSW11_IV]|uniref:alkaline phosphatase family protein n=1 Tax=Bacteriovorax sp. BSW11_IV TaxID=1353529 RepID=UPI000389EDA2|nr:ectonucleotide pyrophosphatase/phosphodiesterase [Bacteriovorax sp. BSW11_IV]EQC47870.1 type I phosphodiesterase/nucleotide pyrophosphatase [Bacteriovorax sp. BSW11_IV]